MRPTSKIAVALLLAGLPGIVEAADPVKVGPEIEVVENEYVDFPRVASDPAGNFMVVWNDTYEASVRGRRFFATGNPQGADFRVSNADQYTENNLFTDGGLQAVAGDAAGNFVVSFFAYETDQPPCFERGCIWSRRFDANGVASSAFLVRDPATTYRYAEYGEDEAVNPEIAADGEGNFIVAWEGYDLESEGVFARRLTAAGLPTGPAFRANATTDGYQAEEGDLDVAADAEGDFVIVWDGHAHPVAYGAVAQRFHANRSPDGPEFMVSADLDYGDSPQVAVAPDGTQMFVWRDGGVITGRIFGANGSAITADFEIANTSDRMSLASGASSFVLAWDDDGVTGQRFDLAGNAISTQLQLVEPGGYDPEVAVHDGDDFVVVWRDEDGVRAQRWQVTPPAAQELLLPGKSLLVGNKLPDDPERNLAKWKVTSSAIVVSPRGGASDPRCNGDPAGTVKATIEFASATSGHGSGVIGLPCQNWIATGGNAVSQVATRGYSYRDSGLDEGPCQTVAVTGKKGIRATCKGKGESTELPYDLVPGTSEGVVTAVLEMGLHRYCTAFDGASGDDGSDGRKFKVGSSPAPVACP